MNEYNQRRETMLYFVKLHLHGLRMDIFNIVVEALFSKIGGIYSLIGASLIIRNVASIIYTVLQYHGKTSRLLLFFVISCLVLLACLGKCSSTYNRFGSCFLFKGSDKQIDSGV